MSWPMSTAPEGMKRGACVECEDPKTVSQVLTSVCVNGTSKCVCGVCVKKPKYHKHLQGVN